MPAPCARAGLFRCAFLHKAPRRYAVTPTPDRPRCRAHQRMLGAWTAVAVHAQLPPNPAAIGVYALLARLFLIYQAPIPLSAADLQRYDPTLSYGAARGALQRLVALRWLSDQSGHKNCYTPTWGVIKGTTQPWRM